MPLVWRGMRMADGQPEVGPGKQLLGVVVGDGPNDDIAAEDGTGRPDTGGMSVSPAVERLPAHRLPRRLKAKYPYRFPGASGSDRLHCWSMGEGDFVAGPFAAGLVLRLDPAKPDVHAFVEPETTMLADEYQAAIAATRGSWTRWEE